MTIWNLGSINVDHVYKVAKFVEPGETLTASSYEWGLGGKGLNQSVAALRSKADVRHLGAIGRGDKATMLALQKLGFNKPWQVDEATGHAIIQVNKSGENSIVIAPGANRALVPADIESALSEAKPGDWLLLQNETNGALDAIKFAKKKGLKTCYAAAPFEPQVVAALIEYVDLLSVNEIELSQLEAAMEVPRVAKLVTLGSRGAYYENESGTRSWVSAFPITPIDTTGAGDTFLGAFLAHLDSGETLANCLHWASAAAALQVTRLGAAPVIPTYDEISHFIGSEKK